MLVLYTVGVFSHILLEHPDLLPWQGIYLNQLNNCCNLVGPQKANHPRYAHTLRCQASSQLSSEEQCWKSQTKNRSDSSLVEGFYRNNIAYQ